MAYAELTEEQKKLIKKLYTPDSTGKAYGVAKIALFLKVKHSQVFNYLKSMNMIRNPQEAQRVSRLPHDKIVL